jgi:hypothetical protein
VEQKPNLNVTDGQAEAPECSSLTAEIIPRQRPEEWDFLARLPKKPGALKGALAKIDAHDLHRPLRVTGQLFFDGSHRVCVNGKRQGGQPCGHRIGRFTPSRGCRCLQVQTFTAYEPDDESLWKPLHVFIEGR